MSHKQQLLLSFSIMLMLSSCSTITPHENFKAHMEYNVGKNIGLPQKWMGIDRYVGSKTLQNGNVENEYKLLGACRYFFEINPASKIIVSWRFEGGKKDCAIAP